MENRAPEMLKPTVIAGGAIGAFVGLPGVDLLNACTCCLMVSGAGFLASYLYSGSCKAAGVAFRPGNGALVGLIAGAFYAVATTIVGTLSQLTIGNALTISVIERMQQWPDLPPEALDQLDLMLEGLESSTMNILSVIWRFFTAVLIGAIWSTVGGLIGGAVFKFEPAPAPPAPPAPPEPPTPPAAE